MIQQIMIVISFACGMIAGWMLCGAVEKVRQTRKAAAQLLADLEKKGFK